MALFHLWCTKFQCLDYKDPFRRRLQVKALEYYHMYTYNLDKYLSGVISSKVLGVHFKVSLLRHIIPPSMLTPFAKKPFSSYL